MRFRLAFAGVLALGGCGTPGPPSPTTIVASDSSVLTPALRIASEKSREYSEPSDIGAGGAFEFNYFRSRGSDTQNVSASDAPIKLGGKTFGGPQQVTHDFTLNWYELDLRARAFSSSSDRALGAEFLFGAAWPRLGFRVSSPTAQASEAFGVFGVVWGVGALWRFRPGTSAQARYSYYAGLGGDRDLTRAIRGEIYLAHALAKNIALRAGYVDWAMHVGRGSASNSDLDVNMRGPSLGLEIIL